MPGPWLPAEAVALEWMLRMTAQGGASELFFRQSPAHFDLALLATAAAVGRMQIRVQISADSSADSSAPSPGWTATVRPVLPFYRQQLRDQQAHVRRLQHVFAQAARGRDV